eukprot:m.139603 g.139603  ORF g.139603 m.139603 type:complete len:133 (-) comp13172_c0_seq1:3173-3571(-)
MHQLTTKRKISNSITVNYLLIIIRDPKRRGRGSLSFFGDTTLIDGLLLLLLFSSNQMRFVPPPPTAHTKPYQTKPKNEQTKPNQTKNKQNMSIPVPVLTALLPTEPLKHSRGSPSLSQQKPMSAIIGLLLWF